MVHEHGFNKLALQASTHRTALDRVLVHIQDPARGPNTGAFGQGFSHTQVVFVTQPNVPQSCGTSTGIAGSAPGAAKQGDLALPIPCGRSNTGFDLSFGRLMAVAERAFIDERAVEPKQARHPLMAEMGHEQFSPPVEVDGFTATSKEGLIASADETQRLV